MTASSQPDERARDSTGQSNRTGRAAGTPAELYRILIESIRDDAIFLIDLQGFVSTWNPGAERMFGYPSGEIVGRPYSLVLSDADAAGRPGDRLLRTAAKAGTLAEEGWRMRRDGTRFWAQVVITPIGNEAGELTGYAAVTRDHTQRHRDEQLFRAAVNASPSGMVMIDADARITLCNRVLAGMFGYAEGDLIGQPLDMLVPQRYRERHNVLTAAFFFHPGSRQMGAGRELIALHADGHEFPVEIGLNPLQLDDAPHVLASIIDITTRRRTQEQLLEREARWRILMDHASDGINIVNAEGIVQDVNPRMCELLGVAREDIIGHHISEFSIRETAAEATGHMHQLARHSGGGPRRTELRRGDGSSVVVDFSSSAVSLGGEELFVAIGRDMTAHLQLENQLRQAQKMEAVGRLAGGVAHDFNNLLTVISGNIELLRDQFAAGTEHHDMMGEIAQASRRAAELTRQLLAFSRQQMLAPRILNLPDLVHSTERMLRRLIGEDVQLVTRCAQDTAPVRADPGQIEQVILNLAVNSRDAMPDGGTITIETRTLDLHEREVGENATLAGGRWVLLAISDTGTGMSDEVKANIFEPFFTTKDPGKGTGLGLATVYGIVKQSEGFVAVDSEQNHGTTFRVYLPAASVPEFVAQEQTPLTAPGGSERLLLVEDDELVRSLARRALERRGYAVLEAADPDQALAMAAAETQPIELLLTDVIMPGMSGRALAERLTAFRPGVRVLYTSGYTDEAILRLGVLEHGLAFLQKPYTPESLARKVREVLDS